MTRFQFRLKKLFVFWLSICLVVGFAAWEVERRRTNLRVSQQLSGIGIYAPLGSFGRITTVCFNGDTVSDESLELLAQLDYLTILSFAGTNVSDKDMAIIAGFRDLRCLDLNKTSISDAAVSHLSQLEKVTSIYVENTRMSYAGIERLAVALPGAYIASTTESPGLDKTPPPDPQ